MRNKSNESADSVRRRSRIFARVAGIAMQLTVVQGCGGPAYRYDATVTGNVLIEGQLVDGGTVTFHPVGGGAPAIGRIRRDGSFSLRMGQGDLREADGGTVPSGEYRITVVVTGEPVPVADLPDSPPKGGPRLMARKYASVDTTELQRHVVPGPNLFQFDLERAGPEESAPVDVPGGETTPTGNKAVPSESREVVAPPSEETTPAKSSEKPAATSGSPKAEGNGS